jgi:hypothetical protein
MKISGQKITSVLSFSLILLCLFSSFKMMETGKKEIKKECKASHEKKSAKEVLNPQRAMEAVVPFVEVKFNHDFYIIKVQEFYELVKNYISINEPCPVSVYFKNLFSYVICVNAP